MNRGGLEEDEILRVAMYVVRGFDVNVVEVPNHSKVCWANGDAMRNEK
jgi:hypothetical protein